MTETQTGHDAAVAATAGLAEAARALHPAWPALATARQELVRDARRRLHCADVFEVLADGDTARGVLAVNREPRSWTGCPVRDLTVELLPGDIDALRWASERVSTLVAGLDDETWVRIPWPHRALVATFETHGFNISSLVLAGSVDAARRAWSERAAAPAELPSDVCIRELVAADVEVVGELRRRVFTEQPQFCWFGASDAYIASWKREVLRAGPDHYGWVVERGGEVAGYFGSRVHMAHVLWGPCGGLDLVLGASVRALGIAAQAYTRILNVHRERGVRVLKGGTSQPAILRYAAEMKRSPLFVFMRRDSPFSRRHFQPWLAAAP